LVGGAGPARPGEEQSAEVAELGAAGFREKLDAGEAVVIAGLLSGVLGALGEGEQVEDMAAGFEFLGEVVDDEAVAEVEGPGWAAGDQEDAHEKLVVNS
jgi:hypothetical protein